MEIVEANEFEKYFSQAVPKAGSVRIDESLAIQSVDIQWVHARLKEFINQHGKSDSESTYVSTAITSLKVLDGDSDLVPNEYEGGFKTWECSVDLCKFLSAKLKADPEFLKNRTVLELGCGSGLPAILCLLHGARKVCFQDYNANVLRFVTAPNCLLNRVGTFSATAASQSEPSAHFIASSWADFAASNSYGTASGESNGKAAEIDHWKFDLILSSETLYNTDNYDSLIDCVRRCLRNENSAAYFASKRHYFGVGGSTAEFRERVGDRLCYRSVSRTNVSGMFREVFSLTLQ